MSECKSWNDDTLYFCSFSLSLPFLNMPLGEKNGFFFGKTYAFYSQKYPNLCLWHFKKKWNLSLSG